MWDEIWIDDEFDRLVEKLVKTSHQVYVGRKNKIQPVVFSQEIKTPWIFITKNPDHQCIKWQAFYYKYFGFYPSYCKHKCYKVVAYPKTCKEMFDLYEQMKDWNLYGKIGVDTRDYIPNKNSNYAAFFHCTGLERGEKVYEIVKGKLGDSMKVILKRTCTEMEIDEKQGKIKENPEWEKRLDDIVDIPHDFQEQADWVKNKTKIFWLKYARKVGDMTYKEVHPLPADNVNYQTFND